jgi:hypothetical protein
MSHEMKTSKFVVYVVKILFKNNASVAVNIATATLWELTPTTQTVEFSETSTYVF